MGRKVIFVNYEGVEIVGAFLHRRQHYIEVEMLEPFRNWTESIGRSGPSRMKPNSLEGPLGVEYARSLLIEAYRELKIIDTSLDRFVLLNH